MADRLMTNTTRLLLLLGIVIAVATAAYLLPLAEWATSLAERARSTGSLGVALYIAAYVIATVAFLPGSILTLAGGFAYGPLWGLAIVSVASLAGATAAFLLGRTLLHDWALEKVRGSPRLRAIDQAVAREGFKLVLLLRLSPLVPFNALNYALSLTNVPLRTYVAASALGMLPGAALYVYLGSLVPTAAELWKAPESGGTSRTILYAAGLAATVAVVVIATRIARRALDDQLHRTT